MDFPVTIRAKSDAWAQSLRPQLFRIINRLGSFTAAELAAAVPTQRLHDITQFAEGLVMDGLLERTGQSFWVRAPLDLPPESAAARKQQQMWNILRGSQGRPSIDAPHLAMLSSTAQNPVSKGEASRYIAALVGASFLRERNPGSFFLPPDRNTGPLAPRLMQAPFVIDPNQWVVSRQVKAQEARL